MGFQPSSNITEQIADHLAWEIAAGRIGDRARIQELKLARSLGVSRGSVREALLVLQGRGLVDLVPRRGATVRPLSAAAVQDFGTLFSDLLLRALQRMETYPASDAARHLDALCAASKSDEVETVLRARDAFLRALLNSSHGEVLLPVLNPLVMLGSRIGLRAAAHADFDVRDSVRWCAGLHEALASKDAERVSALVNAFVRRECQLAQTTKFS